MVSADVQPPASTATAEADAETAALREAVRRGIPAAIGELSRLVRIPSVSWDGFDPKHVARSADAVAELLESLGLFDRVEVARAAIAGSDELGQPAVLATRAARPGHPTVLLYAHHDVQPPGLDAHWGSPPYEPTLRDGRLFARGAADDKAGIMVHIAALRAVTEVLGERFGLGLAVFIEGEEEFGSRSFTSFLDRYREQLAADAIVVADSGNWSVDTPAITVSLRGNVAVKMTVTTLDHALHSGMFGGAVPDAMLATVRLLASLHDADGAVAVEGMTAATPQTPEYDEARLREESGLLDGVSPIGRGTLLQRIWAQPAITVTGIDAPSVMAASNTLTPSITVKISARVAPGQSAADAWAALERHLAQHAPFGARLEFSDLDLGEAFQVDTSGPAFAAAKRAMAEAWQREAVEMGVGGSIPFIAELVERFPRAEILVTGIEDPDTRAHAPDESLDLSVFHRAVIAEALLLAGLHTPT